MTIKLGPGITIPQIVNFDLIVSGKQLGSTSKLFVQAYWHNWQICHIPTTEVNEN